jgi:uncharacterized protein involved in exopolysaccharide biosynthesis
MPSNAERPHHDTFSNLLLVVWDRRIWVTVAAVVSLILTALYLHFVTFRYTAKYEVIPAQEKSSINGEGLAGIGRLAGLKIGEDEAVSPFELYLRSLRSEETAQALSQDSKIMQTLFLAQWDDATHGWKKPESMLSWAKPIKSILGLPSYAWSPPNALDLQNYIQRHVSIEEDPDLSIAAISTTNQDPEFARYFLQHLHMEADKFLKDRALKKAKIYIDYLQEQLNQTNLAELRLALSQELGTQVKMRMLASSDAAFAAEPVGNVSVTKYPTNPNALLTLVLGTILGPLAIILGILLCYYLGIGKYGQLTDER